MSRQLKEIAFHVAPGAHAVLLLDQPCRIMATGMRQARDDRQR